jgi:hypothetical protein
MAKKVKVKDTKIDSKLPIDESTDLLSFLGVDPQAVAAINGEVDAPENAIDANNLLADLSKLTGEDIPDDATALNVVASSKTKGKTPKTPKPEKVETKKSPDAPAPNSKIEKTIEEEYIQHTAKKVEKVKRKKVTKEKVKEAVVEVVEAATTKDAAKIVERAMEDDDDLLEKLEAVDTKKGRVTFRLRGDAVPRIVGKFIENVINESDHLLSFRTIDVNITSAVNRRYMVRTPYFLPLGTYIFKPNHKMLKVNRGTRFMFASYDDKPDEYLIYLQEGVKKTAFMVKASDYKSTAEFYKIFTKAVLDFYRLGFEVAVNILTGKAESNPLGKIMTMVVEIENGKKYEVKPTTVDGSVISFEITTKYSKNKYIKIIVSEENGKYNIGATDTFSKSTKAEHSLIKNLSYAQLSKKIVDTVEAAYDDTNWSEVFNIPSDIANQYNDLAKLRWKSMREAYLIINEASEDTDSKVNITIDAVMSNHDFKTVAKRNEYYGEAIIGSTDDVEWNLIYYYILVKGGDTTRPEPREWITSEKYYELRVIYTREEYQKRINTILKRQNNERRYSTRVNLFQLEYKKKGKKDYHIFKAKTFKEILEHTKFLSKNVQYPESKL